MDERAASIGLSLCSALERVTLRRLVEAYGSSVAVWEAEADSWLSTCRIRTETARRLDAWRLQVDPHAAEMALLEDGVQCVVQGDSLYPQRLYDLPDAPLVLFVRGNLAMLHTTLPVSVVGTRRASNYAIEATTWIAETLSKNGCGIISGLAYGVDVAAHQAAVNSSGATMAVLASGVNVCYPTSHTRLYREIMASGAVVSEYPPDALVKRHRFPERNRLIAALSPALILVQAGEKSGALHTVDAALELGRDIYVVPGPITSSLFRGSNRLLQQGAQILLDPFDYLKEIGRHEMKPAQRHLPERFAGLYERLLEPQSAVQLASVFGRPVQHVYSGLLELELAGWIERAPGGLYRRKQM